jgi:hypothetical protein
MNREVIIALLLLEGPVRKEPALFNALFKAFCWVLIIAF